MNEPKPTGEWTAEWFAECVSKRPMDFKTIYDAHNAALAVEREKVAPPVDNKFVADGCAQFGELPAKTEAVFIMNRSLMLENQQLREQHTVEREAHLDAEERIAQLSDQYRQLREQLDAEREKVKMIVDALKLLRYDANGHITAWPNEKQFRDALAKMGEGK